MSSGISGSTVKWRCVRLFEACRTARFPLFSTLGGAVFVDAGNVYKTYHLSLDDVRYGVGVGFRYLSPVGPLRIDIAKPLNPRWYDDSLQYFFTLGYAF